MVALWNLYWPVAAIGFLLGVAIGLPALRLTAARARKLALIAIGVAGSIAAAALWHGPGGAADRLIAAIVPAANAEIARLELPTVRADLERDPLKRSLVLDGKADDFQARELPRYLLQIPGVAGIRWRGAGGGYAIPLLAEAAFAALTAFLLGMLLAYLIELRRRANADRRW